ncbi:MAG: Rpn family recombination-promoting nuclease/putative transposase, partial [Eubacteriales bacterium]|nr:Rpn family recombination-promoting nuclease/putative transposase [Eubacteriales bacterium]
MGCNEAARKKFQDLTVKDAFMFAAVMSDEVQCRRFLELVLEMDILEVTVITEKTMTYHPEYRGVRLDVLAKEDGRNRRFNIEMQVKKETDLPRRSRYYHSHMDMDALLTGHRYGELSDTFVIFICDYAISEPSLYRSTYRTQCQENGELLQDGRTTIFLSTKGENENEVPKELSDFLKYIGSPEELAQDAESGSLIASIEDQVRTIKRSRIWEARFVLMEELLQDERELGRKEGLEEGREEGLDRMSCLMRLLK